MHSSWPGLRNGCNSHVCDTYGYLLWGLIYLRIIMFGLLYTHVAVHSDKPCCVPWQFSKPAACCLLRLAPRWWIIWLEPFMYLVILSVQPRKSLPATTYVSLDTCMFVIHFHRMDGPHSMLPAMRAMSRLLSCYYKQELVWRWRQRWGGSRLC